MVASPVTRASEPEPVLFGYLLRSPSLTIYCGPLGVFTESGGGWHYHADLPFAVPVAEGSRVVYHRAGGVTEWYEVRGDAVEQGFDVAARPAGDFVIVGVITSLEVPLEDEFGVTFGQVRYGDQLAYDATGTEIPVELDWSGEAGTATLRILAGDLDDAVFPVTIDPLVSTAGFILDPTNLASARFGASMARVPDLNGDGYDELAVGSPGWANASGVTEGRVDVYLGSSSGTWNTTPSWTIDPTNQAGAEFGAAIASADVNNDNRGDLLIGAPGYSGSYAAQGRVYLYYGAANGTFTLATWSPTPPTQSAARFGSAVAIGPLDGASCLDVVVGAPGLTASGYANVGRVYSYQNTLVARPSLHCEITTATTTIPSPTTAASVQFGSTLAVSPSADGDAYGELLVAGPGRETDTGAVWWFKGAATGVSATPTGSPWVGRTTHARLGTGLAVGRDLNGDGLPDLAVGAPSTLSTSAGEVDVFLGTGAGFAGTSGRYIVYGSALASRFGTSVSMGDTGGDGWADLLVGAPGDEAAGVEGRARLLARDPEVSGFTLREQWSTAPTGRAFAHYGQAVTVVDHNAAVGAPDWNYVACPSICFPVYPAEGRVYGFAGQLDQDGDSIPDASDNCPLDANRLQTNDDGDAVGNACECRGLTAGTVCNASKGICDQAETCTGTTNACPSNQWKTAGVHCRYAAGPCDIEENCTGYGPDCPADAKVPLDIECRASTGPCDLGEVCDGTSVSCPPDVRVAAGFVCRAAADLCDTAEACDGIAATCPADGRITCTASSPCRDYGCDPAVGCVELGPKPDYFVCEDGNPCSFNEYCLAGECVNPGTTIPCPDDGNPCTIEECPSYACQHTPMADGTVCDDGFAHTHGERCLTAICQPETIDDIGPRFVHGTVTYVDYPYNRNGFMSGGPRPDSAYDSGHDAGVAYLPDAGLPAVGAGVNEPLPYSIVEVESVAGTAVTTTDGFGEYRVTAPGRVTHVTVHAESETPYPVKVLSGWGLWRIDEFLREDAAWARPPYSFPTSVPPSGSLDVLANIAVPPAWSKPFNVYHAAIRAAAYIASHSSETLQPMCVQWAPYSINQYLTYQSGDYEVESRCVRIGSYAAYSDDVVFHEAGHWYQHHYSPSAMMEVPNGYPWEQVQPGVAFREGWASAFAAWVKTDASCYADPTDASCYADPTDHVNIGEYPYSVDVRSVTNPEIPDGQDGLLLGQTAEMTVAAALYSLEGYDLQSAAFEAVESMAADEGPSLDNWARQFVVPEYLRRYIFGRWSASRAQTGFFDSLGIFFFPDYAEPNDSRFAPDGSPMFTVLSDDDFLVEGPRKYFTLVTEDFGRDDIDWYRVETFGKYAGGTPVHVTLWTNNGTADDAAVADGRLADYGDVRLDVYDVDGNWLAGSDDTSQHLEAVGFDLSGPADGCWSPVFYVRVHPTFDAEPASGRVLSYFGYYGLERIYAGTTCNAGCDLALGAWRQCWASYSTYTEPMSGAEWTCADGGSCMLYNPDNDCSYAGCSTSARTGVRTCRILDQEAQDGNSVPYTPTCIPMPVPVAGGVACPEEKPGWYKSGGFSIDYGTEWVPAGSGCCWHGSCSPGESHECYGSLILLCAK